MSNRLDAQLMQDGREALAAVRDVAASTDTESASSMSQPALNDEPLGGTNNVRLVLVDGNHQFRYLQRAARLEKAMNAAAAKHGVEPEDIPGLHGLCVEAVRAAERKGH